MTDDQTADECGICLEKLTAAVTLPCKHKFCAGCLDGWKSKFGSFKVDDKEEKSKSCPLCRTKIPPSKDMLIQLKYYRAQVHEFEDKGDTTSERYINRVKQMKELEAQIGDYDGEGLDYDDNMEIPAYIVDAVEENNLSKILSWLDSPVDMKKLNARDPNHLNSTLVHLAIGADNSDLLSILLQYGADVNVLDANGYNALMYASLNMTKLMNSGGFEQAKILLEWGAEISLPPNVARTVQDKFESNRDAFIQFLIQFGDTKLANLFHQSLGVEDVR